MQRLFNIIIILAIYLGFLYNKDLDNKRKDTSIKDTKTVQKQTIKHSVKYSNNMREDLY